MAVIKYNPAGAAESVLTTTLNSLANNDSQITAVLSNDAAGELDLFCLAELTLAAQASARDACATVELYLVESLDDTNYAYGSDALIPAANKCVGVFMLDNTTTARIATSNSFKLPPTNFKLLVFNKTGQAFAVAGSILKIRRFSMQSV